MGRRGFTYFDWNVSSDDATKHSDEGSIYSKVMKGCKGRTSAVVLMHDSAGHEATADALKNIIAYGKEYGYSFKTITSDTPVVTHRVNN